MLNYLIPPIGIEGTFTLKEPLNTIINERQNYKVVAVRSIKEMIESDEDVKQFIYLDQSLTEEDFNNDVKNNVPIVSLMGEDGGYYYIPANRILSIPKINGKIFRYKTIAVNLGLVPDDQDFNFLIDEIKDLVMTYYGIEADVNLVDVSSGYIYTQTEYENFENSRKLKIQNFKPCRLLLKEADDKISLMKKKISTLLQKLQNN
jgi:hypothetical protein